MVTGMRTPHNNRGYTLIELLIVMGIILLMMTMVLLSVTSMLRSSRMSRAVSLMVSAADEARTAAITVRRSTRIDNTQLDAQGFLNRLTVAGPFLNENFETYNIDSTATAVTTPPLRLPSANGWVNTVAAGPAGWPLSNATVPCIQNDGTQCMRIIQGQSYWNVGARVDQARDDDFEVLVEARVKFLPPPAPPNGPGRVSRTIRIMACVQGAATSSYGLSLTINPTLAAFTATKPPGRNTTSTIQVDKNGTAIGATAPAVNPMTIDVAGAGVSATTALVENVWYRVVLSVKLVTDQTGASRAYVAGKVYADGQLEPWAWTVGPVIDGSPLTAGPGGFSCTGYDGLVDDVLFDGRPIRVIPAGLRMDCLDPVASTAATPVLAAVASPYNFPIIFRPDGTAAQTYLIRITDMTSADKRYVRIDQNTGHSRTCHDLTEALLK